MSLDEATLRSGELITAKKRVAAGVYEAKINDISVLVKDGANRENLQARRCIPLSVDLKREYSAFRLNELLGHVVEMPLMALRPEGLVMEVVSGEHLGGVTLQSRETQLRLALFDGLIGNTDRHSMNYFVTKAKTIICIDHGLSFPEPSLYHNSVDLGSVDFTDLVRNDKLPQWATDILTRITAEAFTIFVELQSLMSPEALQGVFARAHWMLKNNSFMSSNTLRTAPWFEAAKVAPKCARHRVVHMIEADCAPTIQVICPVHKRQHGDKRQCPPPVLGAVRPGIIAGAKDKYGRIECLFCPRGYHYPWQFHGTNNRLRNRQLSRHPGLCGQHHAFHTNGIKHKGRRNHQW